MEKFDVDEEGIGGLYVFGISQIPGKSRLSNIRVPIYRLPKIIAQINCKLGIQMTAMKYMTNMLNSIDMPRKKVAT